MLLRRRALLRRLQANPEFALRVLEAAAANGADCARAVRHQRRLAAPRGRAHRRARSSPTSATTSRSASTPRTTPAARWPTRSPPCVGGATQVQGTINGYGERTGNCNLMTIIPNLTLKMGVEHPARGPPRAAHRRQPPRRRARQPAAAPRRPLRRARRRSPTRAACTPRRSAAPAAPPTSTSTPRSSATTPGCWCPTSVVGPACP